VDQVTKVRVQYVRAHDDFVLDMAPGVTVITGPNGSGKTSLIEALYVALQGSSFKGSDGELLRHDQPWYRIDVEFESGARRTVKFESARVNGRKQFVVDGKTNYRLLPAYKYPVVLFEPDDLRLLGGSPVRRRQFIDRFISQLDPKYATTLRRYERIVRQRNVLLKQQAPSDALFAWDVSLSDYGAYIIDRRLHFINELNQRLETVYRAIARTPDAVAITYSQRTRPHLQQWLLTELHAHMQKDIVVGATSVGPHRHDVLFSFNGSPATGVASRGEVRSIVLGLKFLEVEIITKVTNKHPIILLDDVFSELDTKRQASLAAGILHNQTIITTTTAVSVKEAKTINLR